MGREYINRGRDQFNIENYHQAPTPPSPTRPEAEQTLLRVVAKEVKTRLEQSLHHAVLLNLPKESQPDRVHRPWQQELKIGVKPPTILSPDQTIDQVFASNEINGKLLILGEPGSGKTTTLLDLAKVLVDRAIGDVSEAIPVILNLSSWNDEKQPIREWMVARLNRQYGVSVQLGRKWLADRKLLPLLDGLDEVAPERQQACVTRINEFLTSENSPFEVVVCSRIEEYENLQTQLQLNGAICLNALTDKQIETYLTRIDRPWLWQMVVANEKLLALVRSPLLLSITVLTYPQELNSQLEQLQSASDPLQFLLDGYVERMLHRQLESRSYGKQKAPTARETRKWLVWLARQMERESQTEFLIEEMQPSMLPDRQKWKFRLFAGMIIGLIMSPIGMMFFDLVFNEPVWGLITVPIGARLGLMDKGSIQLSETIKWSWAKGRKGLAKTLIILLIFGGTTYLGMIAGMPFGVILILVLFIVLDKGLEGKSIETKTSPNQGMKRSLTFFLVYTLLGGLMGCLVWEASYLIFGGMPIGLLYGLSIGLSTGLLLGIDVGGGRTSPSAYSCTTINRV